jgi:hypothetical protein
MQVYTKNMPKSYFLNTDHSHQDNFLHGRNNQQQHTNKKLSYARRIICKYFMRKRPGYQGQIGKLLRRGKCFIKIDPVTFFLNNQLDALIMQIYSVIKLYMFRAPSLPNIRIFLLYIRHW